MYPNIKWVFFGDSGEKDTKIYKKIYKEFPSRIKSIYIRDVNSKKLIKVF